MVNSCALRTDARMRDDFGHARWHRPGWRFGGSLTGVCAAIAVALAVIAVMPGSAQAACANPVACENALPGDPPSSTWWSFDLVVGCCEVVTSFMLRG